MTRITIVGIAISRLALGAEEIRSQRFPPSPSTHFIRDWLQSLVGAGCEYH